MYDGSRYLIEKFSISYVPSLSILEFLSDIKKKDRIKILALGNPDLNDKKLDLPAAEAEVETIKILFPAATVLKRKQATEAYIKKMAKHYHIVHFAGHGEYLPDDPLSSSIRLTPGENEDGHLEAREIFDLDMNTDLVVMSACQTSIGQIRKGDEIVGLTRAFLYAGSHAVLGSLWSISDEATSVLMKEFYLNIKDVDYPEALRKAQLMMIRSERYSAPFYWAAFSVTGSLGAEP